MTTKTLDHLEAARRTIDVELNGLALLGKSLDGRLGEAANEAVEMIRQAKGRLIITGVGKSGHIGRKIASTLASTGTPAYFLHAGEASHGDLGMITVDDIVIAMSWSGESTELSVIVAYTRRFRIPLIAVTSRGDSALGSAADLLLEMPQVQEACPNGLAPTTSTILLLALGDAIAMALLESRGFSPSDFSAFHPGGKLGANLKMARDIMHVGDALPLVALGASMKEAIYMMTSHAFGCVGIVQTNGRLAGIITDGDLRRNLSDDLLTRVVDDIMTPNPICVQTDTLLSSVLETLNSRAITTVFVSESDKPIGILHLHDLLRTGVV